MINIHTVYQFLYTLMHHACIYHTLSVGRLECLENVNQGTVDELKNFSKVFWYSFT